MWPWGSFLLLVCVAVCVCCCWCFSSSFFLLLFLAVQHPAEVQHLAAARSESTLAAKRPGWALVGVCAVVSWSPTGECTSLGFDHQPCFNDIILFASNLSFGLQALCEEISMAIPGGHCDGGGGGCKVEYTYKYGIHHVMAESGRYNCRVVKHAWKVMYSVRHSYSNVIHTAKPMCICI